MNMQNLPLVSVITVVRNGAATISQTLDSVRMQRQVLVEHIVIDGASSDSTTEILKTYQSDQLRWVSERDQGIYDAMNKGIRLARGEWLLFLGADDALSDQNVLADVFRERDLSPYDLVCGNSRFHSGRHCVPRLGWRTQIFNTIHHQAAFYRRHLFDDFQYRLDIPVVADYEINFLIYFRHRSVLFLDHEIAVCSNQGISHTSSQFAAQIDLYKVRSRYINTWLNSAFLIVGFVNLAITRLIRSEIFTNLFGIKNNRN